MLFRSYIAREDSDIVLFYVIKKGVNASKNPWAKLSIGFINGEPEFMGTSGGVTVNASNEGFRYEQFKSVLG